jgi:hypothetical protein
MDMQNQSALALREAQSDPAASRPGNLSAILERIEKAIEEETAGIRTEPRFDIKASNARKSRHLYELSRAMDGVGAAALAAEQKDGIIRLRKKLVENEAVLRAHLAAVGEVAGLIQDAIERSEADGTYTAGEFGKA